MRRVLMLAWLFPPHGSIGAKRPYRFARALPSLGWNATVLCGHLPPARLSDPTPWSVPPGVTIEPHYDARVVARAAAWLDARASVRPAKPQADRAPPRRDLVPTETIAVHAPHAYRTASRLVDRDRPSVIWSTSYPYSSHVVAAAVAARHRLPLVLDLRDPWTLNFVHDAKHPIARRVERALEHATFHRASAVVVTTERLADAYRRLYPSLANRFVAIRNGFERVPLPPRTVPPDPFRLVHFGHVYGERSLAPVLHALARLRARGLNAFRLENHGRFSSDDLALAHRLGLAAHIEVTAALPYLEGLARIRSAGVALLPAWGTDRGELFLPGKLYDYLLARIPIVAIGENPELAGILAHTRTGDLFAPDAVDAIADRIETLARGASFEPDDAAIAAYSAERGAVQLAALLDRVTDAASA